MFSLSYKLFSKTNYVYNVHNMYINRFKFDFSQNHYYYYQYYDS